MLSGTKGQYKSDVKWVQYVHINHEPKLKINMFGRNYISKMPKALAFLKHSMCYLYRNNTTFSRSVNITKKMQSNTACLQTLLIIRDTKETKINF